MLTAAGRRLQNRNVEAYATKRFTMGKILFDFFYSNARWFRQKISAASSYKRSPRNALNFWNSTLLISWRQCQRTSVLLQLRTWPLLLYVDDFSGKRTACTRHNKQNLEIIGPCVCGGAMGVDHGETGGQVPPHGAGTLMQIVPPQILSYRYKNERSVAFKICQNPFSAGALPRPRWGAHDAPPNPLVGCRGGTPHYTPTPLSTDPPSALAMRPSTSPARSTPMGGAPDVTTLEFSRGSVNKKIFTRFFSTLLSDKSTTTLPQTCHKRILIL